MKIASLVCTYPPYNGGMGGAAKQFAELASKRHHVVVFTPRYSQTLKDRVDSGVEVRYLNTPFKFGNAAWLPQLIWYLRKFDLAYLHYPFYGVHKMAYNFPLLFRRPLITHYHMDTIEQGWRALPFWLSRKAVLPLVLFFSKKIVVSSYDYIAQSNIAKYYQKRPEKFIEIPFWVDSDKFKPTESSDERTSLQILFVGGLDAAHYFKGLDVLLSALRPLIGLTKKNIKLVIVGEGELRQGYEKIVRELGLEEYVEFAGKLADEELVRAYQASDIFVLPSINKSEAFGIVLLEAMSCGLPVVASNLTGVRSVFVNNESGLTFEAGSASDLTDKLSVLMADDESRRSMGKNARERVLRYYQVEKIDKLLEDLYEDCYSK